MTRLIAEFPPHPSTGILRRYGSHQKTIYHYSALNEQLSPYTIRK
jgi:hypothetical protein